MSRPPGVATRQKMRANFRTWLASSVGAENPVRTAQAEAGVANDMSISYYILIESMCDVGIMPPKVRQPARLPIHMHTLDLYG